jgi:hypothetical protein
VAIAGDSPPGDSTADYLGRPFRIITGATFGMNGNKATLGNFA